MACTRCGKFRLWRRGVGGGGDVLPRGSPGTGGGTTRKGGRTEGLFWEGLSRGTGALAPMPLSHWGHELSGA